ncbi:MAG: penicillin-insensitive murein endopeptidase [Polyangiaceae bacterium]|nr:penicillin-insensitive murein endopeptidase [Polyangiaceae bacterium]
MSSPQRSDLGHQAGAALAVALVTLLGVAECRPKYPTFTPEEIAAASSPVNDRPSHADETDPNLVPTAAALEKGETPALPSSAAAAASSEPAPAIEAAPEGGTEGESDGPLATVLPTGSGVYTDRYFPFLEDENEQGSVSVGDTSYGYIVGARHITEGESLAILPRQKGRDLGYGTDQMIRLLEDAARKFRARTGTKFWIGNIGRRGGGDIIYSVSHNSGRDADVALAYTTAAGTAIDPPDLVQVDSAGVSRDKEHKYRFDPARTWQTVRALLESSEAQIEFLFLARNLTEKILRHAAEKKEPAHLIERATVVLHQPAGAPHDDHLHVRVACSERDVEGGCQSLGPARTWVNPYNSARARRIERSVAALHHASPEQRARGIERLILLEAKDHQQEVAEHLSDPESRVRAAAAHAISHWGSAEDGAAIAAQLKVETDPTARAAMLSALSQLGGEAAGIELTLELANAGSVPWGRMGEAAYQPGSPAPFLMLAEALSPIAVFGPSLGLFAQDHTEPSFAMKLLIIDAAGLSDRPEVVEPMFVLLRDEDSTIRAHAALALSRLLNRPVDGMLENESLPLSGLTKTITDLEREAAPLKRNDRIAWVIEGFSKAGFKIPKVAGEHGWELLRALGTGEPYSHNAARLLRRVALGLPVEGGKKAPPKPPLFEESHAECLYWLKWLRGHTSKLSLPAPPDNLNMYCK